MNPCPFALRLKPASSHGMTFMPWVCGDCESPRYQSSAVGFCQVTRS